MKKLLTLAVLLIVAVLGITAYQLAPQRVEEPTPVVLNETKPAETKPPTVNELLTLVNQERAKVGVAPLALDERLNKSAQQKADDMVARNYYGHIDPDGRQGYDIAHEYAPECISTSENLINLMSEYSTTAENAVTWWMYSKAHREAILSPDYPVTGFGVAGYKVVEHFCQFR